jgi:uncharacterized protein involved in exopolysaccharide biosynthesis
MWIGRSSHGGNNTALNLDKLQRRLRIHQEGRSRIIAVSYTSTVPDMAATVANRVAELYVEGLSEQQRADDDAELARLDGRIAQLKIDVERSGTAVRAFLQQRPNAASTAIEAQLYDQRLQGLEREAVAKGQLYHTLLRRQQELRDEQAIIEPDAHILSLAVIPDRPSSPNPFLFILPAFLLFLICGSLLSVLLERLDQGCEASAKSTKRSAFPA